MSEREDNLDLPEMSETESVIKIGGLPTAQELQKEYAENLGASFQDIAPVVKVELPPISDVSDQAPTSQTTQTADAGVSAEKSDNPKMSKDEIVDRILEFYRAAGRSCRHRDAWLRMSKVQLTRELNRIVTEGLQEVHEAPVKAAIQADPLVKELAKPAIQLAAPPSSASAAKPQGPPLPPQPVVIGSEAVLLFNINKTLLSGFAAIHNQYNPSFDVVNTDVALNNNKDALIQAYAELYAQNRKKLEMVLSPVNRILMINAMAVSTCIKSKQQPEEGSSESAGRTSD